MSGKRECERESKPSCPHIPGPNLDLCVYVCVCVCVLVKVSPPRSFLGGGRAHVCTRNKMTHCRGHSRTAPPGTCRSRDRGQERHQSRQPPRTGCGCYTCRGKTESWENNGLEPGGLRGQERNGHPQIGKEPWKQGQGHCFLFPACSLFPTRQVSGTQPQHGIKLRARPGASPHELLPQIPFITSVSSAHHWCHHIIGIFSKLTGKPLLCSWKSKTRKATHGRWCSCKHSINEMPTVSVYVHPFGPCCVRICEEQPVRGQSPHLTVEPFSIPHGNSESLSASQGLANT